jgi:hypothetical protein
MLTKLKAQDSYRSSMRQQSLYVPNDFLWKRKGAEAALTTFFDSIRHELSKK